MKSKKRTKHGPKTSSLAFAFVPVWTLAQQHVLAYSLQCYIAVPESLMERRSCAWASFDSFCRRKSAERERPYRPQSPRGVELMDAAETTTHDHHPPPPPAAPAAHAHSPPATTAATHVQPDAA